MSAIPSRRLAITFALVVSTVAVFVQRCTGADDAQQKLPEAVQRLLGWLPGDTETIVVAQSFRLQTKVDPSWDDLKLLSLGEGSFPLPDCPAGKHVIGRKVLAGVDGGRKFEVVSSFGSLRYHGCSIVQLEEPLPDAGRGFTDALRKEATLVRTIADTEVFVFPDGARMESCFKLEPWQGVFIALPQPDVLLCASSDVYLRDVLRRLAHPEPAMRALPPQLPEWKNVDPAAPAWMLRHIPGEAPGQLAVGLTWCLRPQGRKVFEVKYIPVAGQSALPLAKVWSCPTLEARPSVEEQLDGTTVVTVDVDKEKLGLWYPFSIYWSMGESGQVVKEK